MERPESLYDSTVFTLLYLSGLVILIVLVSQLDLIFIYKVMIYGLYILLPLVIDRVRLERWMVIDASQDPEILESSTKARDEIMQTQLNKKAKEKLNEELNEKTRKAQADAEKRRAYW